MTNTVMNDIYSYSLDSVTKMKQQSPVACERLKDKSKDVYLPHFFGPPGSIFYIFSLRPQVS